MKRILAMIALAVLTIGLAGSCSKNYEERLDKTDASVADIKAAIGQYENLKGDITSVIEALRAEVGTRPASEQKTIWDCINALQNQKGTFEAAIAALNALVGNEAVSVQIDEAIAELISDYHLDGLAADIQAIRDKLNEKSEISALADQVAQLQKRAESIARILSVIGAYEDMIQSVRINPASADGSVTAERGILTFTFTVTPAEALSSVKNLKGCLKLYANEVVVKTKAGAFAEIPVTKAEVIDKANGEVSVEADVAKFLPNGKARALSIALNVRTGVNDYTTEFVTVSNYIPDYLPGFFTVNGEGKQVRFSKGNLQYVVAGKTWGFYENQYDFCNAKIYPGHHSDTISLFTWGYDATKSIIPDGKDSDNVSITSGSLSPEQDWGCTVGDGKTWRTLTAEEWQYLFSDKSRYGFATVGGVNGIIILPDTFADPMRNGGSGAFKPNKTGYDTNVYTAGGNWEAMESAGAVFLSAAGYRNGSYIDPYIGFTGYYWSSTARDGGINAFDVTFNEYQVIANSFTYGRSYGKSVRLVMDVK